MAFYAREQYFAELAIWRASILTKRIQFTASEISKDDNSPVTTADFAAQALIIKALRDNFPGDAFLGEEDSTALRNNEPLRNKVFALLSSATDAGGVDLPVPASVEEMLELIDLGGRGTNSDSGRVWVMDPVDGTAAFLKGQQYAVSLALLEDGEEVVGVLGCPNISMEMTRVTEGNLDTNGGIMLTAVRNQGSAVRTMSPEGLGNRMPLGMLKTHLSTKLHIVDCVASKSCRHDVIAELANRFETTFPNTEVWSSHIRYASLIVGGGDVQFLVPANTEFKMYIWDHAGAQLIFTELGGKVTDLDGNAIDFRAGRDLSRNRGLVAARAEVHQAVLETMNKILIGNPQVVTSANL